jgi:SAM-dependent methyltransferase
MNLFKYLHYFLFLAINWNLKIAIYIIYHEIKGEKKYHINSTGTDSLKFLKKQGIDISHATIYMPVVYPLLEKAFEYLPAQKAHFLDMGCGKGRALCVAAFMGFKNISGIDFSEKLCRDAEKNKLSVQQLFPSAHINIINRNVLDYTIPDDIDCLFFFNPFDEIVMAIVLNNIITSLKKNKRCITIFYVNPLHKHLFLNTGFTEVFYYKKLTYLELSVLKSTY